MGRGQQIDADLKAAMKQRDELKVSCLRMVRAALAGKAKDLRRELDDAEQIAVLKTLHKQRREAAEQFTQGNRPELAEKELAEAAIIEQYLPQQLDEAQLTAVVDEVIAELKPGGPKDMGPVMKAAMAKLGGAADGKVVSAIVRQRLAATQ